MFLDCGKKENPHRQVENMQPAHRKAPVHIQTHTVQLLSEQFFSNRSNKVIKLHCVRLETEEEYSVNKDVLISVSSVHIFQ